MIYELCFYLKFEFIGNIEKICGIYCISNSKYFYIGQSVDIYRRWNKHRWELKNDKHKNQIMQNVYNLYKEDDPFEYAIIKESEAEELNRLEKEFVIEYYYKFPDKRCMNIADPEKCYTSNPETRQKISMTMTGRSLSEETKAKMSESRKGQKHEWSRKKMVQMDTEGNVIKIWDSIKDAETELNIRYHKKNKLCGGYQWQPYEEWLEKPKGKVQHKHNITDTVKQFDLQGNFIKEWASIKEASEGTNTAKTPLTSCLNGKGKTAGGFLWSYTYEVNTNIAPNRSKYRKPVKQFTLDETFIKEWESVQKASEELGIKLGAINNCIKRTQKQAGGYIWER